MSPRISEKKCKIVTNKEISYNDRTLTYFILMDKGVHYGF